MEFSSASACWVAELNRAIIIVLIRELSSTMHRIFLSVEAIANDF